jgi:hypothetical protein
MMNASLNERAQRLPRDMALVTLLIQAGFYMVGIGYILLSPSNPNSKVLRELYSSAQFLIPILAREGAALAFPTVLAWALARNFVDNHGAGGISNPSAIRNSFAAVYLAISGLSTYGVNSFTLLIQNRLFHGSWLEHDSLRQKVAWYVLIQSALAWVIVILAVVVSFWIAASRRRASSESLPAGHDVAPPPSRFALALACGVFFVAVQMWAGNAVSGWLPAQPADQEYGQLVSNWIAGPLVACGLAVWGAWLGLRQPAQARPLRAFSATLVAFMLLQGICIALALGWVLWIYAPTSFYPNEKDFLGAIVVLAICYAVLLFVLMYWATRYFYRGLQVGAPGQASRA